jgi:alpha-L-fucosidase 2
MKKLLQYGCLFFAGCLFINCASNKENGTNELKLWYNEPAKVWEEALPIGNGSLGAMVFGKPLNEIYQLNEETLWSGPMKESNNPKCSCALPMIREAINNEDYKGAEELWKKNCQGPYTARYLPLANLLLNMHVKNNNVENFYRDLNISNATTTVSYEIDDVKYKRTSFVSYPDRVLVLQLETDKKKSLSFDVGINYRCIVIFSPSFIRFLKTGCSLFFVTFTSRKLSSTLFTNMENLLS